MTTRVVFMGTPEAAIPTLEALTEHHDVALVLTQPDRPRGRSSRPRPTPLKQRAEQLGIAVAQPERSSQIEDTLVENGPFDVGVVVAYGRILRPEVLELPRMGLLNVHFSLLPRWRGAAPVARALIAGDPMTGVTIMKMDEGLDTGPVLTAQAVDIAPDENAGLLTERLSRLGARLLVASLVPYLSGDLHPIRQSDEGLTYANKIETTDRPIDPASDVARVVNQIRGLAPEPGATIAIDGEPHKVLSARPAEQSPPQGRWHAHDGVPLVGLADGGIELLTLQPPGKRVMPGVDWVRGLRRAAGTIG